MPTREEPKSVALASDADFEATDGGWDPYVTSLMLGESPAQDAGADDDEGEEPVMSFSRLPGKRAP